MRSKLQLCPDCYASNRHLAGRAVTVPSHDPQRYQAVRAAARAGQKPSEIALGHGYSVRQVFRILKTLN